MRSPGQRGGRSRPKGTAPAVVLLLLVTAVLGSSRASRAYLYGPPAGHTGGFGEPACQRCHFDAPVNPPEARLEVKGFPDRFVPDSSYRLAVRLTAPDLGRAGFEAAVRCSEGGRAGEQAGRLRAPDARAEVVRGGGGELTGDSTVLYARHTVEGTTTTAPDTAAWRLWWTAPPPEGGCASVALHAAVNAADGDASEFGDRIVTLAVVSVAASGEERAKP